MIKFGDRGVKVIELQNALNNKVAWGTTPKLIPDGHFGNATLNAVKMFQNQNKIRATGIADEQTLNVLGIKSSNISGNAKNSIFSNLSPMQYLGIGIFSLGVIAFISHQLRK